MILTTEQFQRRRWFAWFVGCAMLLSGGACGPQEDDRAPQLPDDAVSDTEARDVSTCKQGTEGCDCYGNDTCNPGLACVQGTCVGESNGGDAGPTIDGTGADGRGGNDGGGADTESTDTEAPTLAFKTPSDGDELTGSVDVAFEAGDDVGIETIEVAVDGSTATTLTEPPFEWTWDTTSLQPGPHTLSATATDGADKTADASIEVDVGRECSSDEDCVSSKVEIVAPSSGASVCGEVPVAIEAEDDEGIDRVELEADGNRIDVLRERPFRTRWDTTGASNGTHTLKATAFDTSDQARFAETRVQVDNTVQNCDNRPTVRFTNPTAGTYLSGRVSVTIEATDDTGVTGVQLFLDGGLVESRNKVPYEFTFDADQFGEGTHTLKAIAEDTADQTASTSIDVNINRTDPMVSITEPGSGQNVWLDPKTVQVEAQASDNNSLEKVELSVGSTTKSVTRSPWRASFDLSGVSGGTTRTVEARAVDAAGRTSRASRSVTIDRPPTVTWASPQSGATFDSKTTLKVDARDDRNLTGVELAVGSQTIGSFQNASGDTYTYDWAPGSSLQGMQTLKAIATDGEGQTTSASRSVDVQCEQTFYKDSDGDGYGDPNTTKTLQTCQSAKAPSGHVDNANDCDDSSDKIYPGAAPKDSQSACMKDADDDGYGDDNPPIGVKAGSDPADNDSTCWQNYDPQNDSDGDGVPTLQDNCPETPNKSQTDPDNDRLGNTCDNCPNVANYPQRDADNDGVGDACESKPNGRICKRTTQNFRTVKPNVFIVMDKSGSMGSGTRMQDAKRALDTINQRFYDKMQFGLMPFSDGTCPGNFNVPLKMGDHSQSKIRSSYQSIQPNGATNLGHALEQVRTNKLYREPGDSFSSQREKVVVVISDGQSQDRSGCKPTDAARQMFQNANVRTYTVGFTSGANRQQLRQIASAGGTNQVFTANNKSQLVSALSNIINKASTQKVISCTYDLNPPSGKRVEPKLWVKIGGAFIKRSKFTFDAKNNELELSKQACNRLQSLPASTSSPIEIAMGCISGCSKTSKETCNYRDDDCDGEVDELDCTGNVCVGP